MATVINGAADEEELAARPPSDAAAFPVWLLDGSGTGSGFNLGVENNLPQG